MSYLSFSFVLFVAITFLVYYVLPVKLRGVVLLCASLVFYGLYDLRYLLFLLFVALSTFLCAIAMGKPHRKTLLLILGIAASATLWAIIKIYPWLSGYGNRFLQFLHLPFSLPGAIFIIPIGISYYTLQAISYLADVYRDKILCEKSFWKYLLFLSYFPAIVQGPISRYDQLSPELLNTKRFDPDGFSRSSFLVLWGLVKKMVIADGLSLIANYAFENFYDLQGMILYIGAVCYAFQLYADFSGCVDICRGVSGMFGIHLIENFNSPYLARSIKEFWNRWHLSLSTWLRDYVYIPLGGNRKGKLRKYGNIAITFLVSGVWHGAGLNFMAWGLLHAIYQIIGECTTTLRAKVKGFLKIKPDSFSDKFYKTVLTFHLTAFAWIFFRTEGLGYSILYIQRMFKASSFWVLFSSEITGTGLTPIGIFAIVAHIVILFAVDYQRKKGNDLPQSFQTLHVFLRWGIYLLLIVDILLFGIYGNEYNLAGFLYGGF